MIISAAASGQEEIIKLRVPGAQYVRALPLDYAMPVTRTEKREELSKRRYPSVPVVADTVVLNAKQGLALFIDQSEQVNANLDCLREVPDDRLKALGLIFNCIPSEELESLKRFKNLTQLYIHCDDVDVDAVMGACRRLEALELYSLNIRGPGEQGPAFSDATFAKLQRLPHLRFFGTQGINLTDRALEELRFWPELECIAVVGAEEISDDGLAALAKCQKLAEVRIQLNRKMTVAGLKSLAALPKLTLLTVEGAAALPESARAELRSALGSVEIELQP